jgi:hypothetical protein
MPLLALRLRLIDIKGARQCCHYRYDKSQREVLP